MFIYREEYYLSFQKPTEATDGDDAKDVAAFLAWQEAMNKKYGLAELIVAKQRHGSTGTVDLHFEARFTRFSDRAAEGRMPEMRG
jgi:replicative DNA helicase